MCNLPLTRLIGGAASAPDDRTLKGLGWIFAIAFLGTASALRAANALAMTRCEAVRTRRFWLIRAVPCLDAAMLQGSVAFPAWGRIVRLVLHRCPRFSPCRSRPTPIAATILPASGIG